MDNNKILKVIKAEKGCIENNHDYCYENCDADCPYYVSESDKLEVFDHLIKVIEREDIHINGSEEEKKTMVQMLADAGFRPSPELIEKYGIQIKEGTD